MLNHQARRKIFTCTCLFSISTVALLALAYSYPEIDWLHAFDIITIPVGAISISAASTLLGIQYPSNKIRSSGFAVLFGSLSFVIFNILFAIATHHIGGESNILGMAICWLGGSVFTVAASIYANLKISSLLYDDDKRNHSTKRQ